MDIELLKRDVKSLTELCAKFDRTIDSLQGIANDLSTMVKLQEQRLTAQEKLTDNFEENYKNSEKEHQKENKEIYDEIRMGHDSVNDKLNNIEKSLLERIDFKLDSLAKNENIDKKSIMEKITEIESWKWMVMGGMFILGWIVSNISNLTKFFKFLIP